MSHAADCDKEQCASMLHESQSALIPGLRPGPTPGRRHMPVHAPTHQGGILGLHVGRKNVTGPRSRGARLPRGIWELQGERTRPVWLQSGPISPDRSLWAAVGGPEARRARSRPSGPGSVCWHARNACPGARPRGSRGSQFSWAGCNRGGKCVKSGSSKASSGLSGGGREQCAWAQLVEGILGSVPS